jgi:bifunctional DNA-binding transcriptional regulator/antitoxin component of YhaV-PrlF toxin-antitoxin module
MEMKTTVSSRGQIVLPAGLRQIDQIEPGAEFSIERLRPGEYFLKRLPTREPHGLVDWLLDCPEKGWYRPVASASTDTL